MTKPPHDRQRIAAPLSQAVCASSKWGGLYLVAIWGTLTILGGTVSSTAHAQVSNSDTIPTGVEIIPTDLPAHASAIVPANRPVSLLPGTIPANEPIQDDLEIPSLATQYHQTLTGNAQMRRQQRPPTSSNGQSTAQRESHQHSSPTEEIPNSSELLAIKTNTSHPTNTTNTTSQSKNIVANGSTYLIQLGAFRDTISAETYWASFRIRYPELSTSHSKQIVRADLGTKGVYHRLQLVGFASPGFAKQKCRQLKADGTDCFTTQP